MGTSLGRFEVVEHTADVAVVATADTLAEALSLVATGMFSVIADLDTVSKTHSVKVAVSSTDTEALVVDWLNELLYRYEAEGFLPKELHVSVDEGNVALNAECLGEPFDPGRHQLGTAVKAATYHLLQVSRDGQWGIRVVLDV